MLTYRQRKCFDHYWAKNPDILHLDIDESIDAFIVIPVLDDDDIFRTIDSLRACTHRMGKVAVLVVVNHSEEADEEIKQANKALADKIKTYFNVSQNEGIVFRLIEAFDLPAKIAGVGLARKLGMDAAAWWLYTHGRIEAPILSLDADTLVEKNYTDAVCDFFRRHAVAGVSIGYEHRLEECEPEMLSPMVKYELYLRYYELALAYTGHPHAYHCIGSAFAVRAEDYVAEGGMNKKQAGEDFYFIQKLIITGRYDLLKSTKVYPSPRISTRTPFGTGRSVLQIAETGHYPVYSWEAFEELKNLFSGIDSLYKADENVCNAYIGKQSYAVREFWKNIQGTSIVMEVNANCASAVHFHNRFFDRFNAFRVLKYMNFVHQGIFRKQEISDAVDEMLRRMNIPLRQTDLERLKLLRNL